MVRVRTVAQLLSGSVVTSVWQTATDEEYDQVRDLLQQTTSNGVASLRCLILEGDLEQEAYIPMRNVDVVILEVTSDEQPANPEPW